MFLGFNPLSDHLPSCYPLPVFVLCGSQTFGQPFWASFIGTRIQQAYCWGVDASHHGNHSLFWRIHSFLANNPNQTGLGITTYFCLLLESFSAKRHILLFPETERAWKPLLAYPGTPFFYSDLRCGSMRTAVTITIVPAGTSFSSRAAAWALCIWVLPMTAEPG